MTRLWLRLKCAMVPALLVASFCSAQEPKVIINKEDYHDRVHACWLGKNVGGTLGMPFEGRRETNDATFYTDLKPGEPAANDDLDLQMLWLKAMEENGGVVDARILGEYWLKYVPVDWNEYGVGKRNMRKGLLPPLSGEYENARWKHSNGAWIRSEIWACLAPGNPELAARMAWEDACVDHGVAEGTFAEMFTASVESAAFVERDRDRLLAIGLSMIPPDCAVARAIHTVIAAKAAGKDVAAAREDVIAATEDTGWFQAPRNIGYTVLGWVYGDGDFGKSICIAVNCGDDTDCTGATLGSILGIINGTKGIPEEWSEPIGTKINTVAIGGFTPPADLEGLTERTIAMAEKVQTLRSSPVRISDEPTDLTRISELNLGSSPGIEELWYRSPYRIVWREEDTIVRLDYVHAPVLEAKETRTLGVCIENAADQPRTFTIGLAGVPEGWQVVDMPSEPVSVAAGTRLGLSFGILAPEVDAQPYAMSLEVEDADVRIPIPVTLFGQDRMGPDNLALATLGATVTADSEYENEPSCTIKAIDGIIATPDDFSNRWHSSLATPHPHWIEVKLPKPSRLGRVVVRFADPNGYPVSFRGLIRPENEGDLVEVFTCQNNAEARAFRTTMDTVVTDTFRLVIDTSANPTFPNAAQISEIELYPPRE